MDFQSLVNWEEEGREEYLLPLTSFYLINEKTKEINDRKFQCFTVGVYFMDPHKKYSFLVAGWWTSGLNSSLSYKYELLGKKTIR